MKRISLLHKHLLKPSAVIVVAALLLAACFQNNYTPKPEGYPRLVLPEHTGYQQFNKPDCPFTFEYPDFAKIVKDTVYFDTIPPDPCWFNIVIPKLSGKIYLSFKPLYEEGKALEEVLSESHTLTFKHSVKAESISQKTIRLEEHDVHGIYYKVGGDAASHVQFFLTDSTRYFVRGALYFHNPPNADSIKPVLDFVKKDIDHMINTFRWKPGHPG